MSEAEDDDAPSRMQEGAGADRLDRAAPTRAWPWMLAAALTYWVGQLIGLPGVDHEALDQLSSQTGGLAGLFDSSVTSFPILGTTLSTLVLVHVVLIVSGRNERPTPRRIGAAIYLALSAVQAFSLALWLESLGSSVGFYYDFVLEPGWGFRLKAVLAMTAGAAVLWWLASRIDATRRAHGALFLLLVATVTSLVPAMLETGEQLSLGVIAPVFALGALSVPIALTIAGGAIALRPPPRWPVPVVLGLELRSPWDALALVLIGGLPGEAIAAALAMARPEAALGWTGTLERVAVVLVGVLFAAWWWFRHRDEEQRAGRPIWALALPALLVVAGFGLIATGGMVIGDGFERVTAPGPLEGEQTFELVLEADDRFAASDADAMVHRLRALGAEAEATERSERRITLRITASSPAPVLDALEPRTLGLHLGGPPLDPALAPPPPITRSTAGYGEGEREVLEGPCEAVRAYRDTLAADGCMWIVQALPAGIADAPSDTCQLGCFDPAPVIASEHVADARVAVDPVTQQPIVSVDLTDEGARRMREATRANLRRPLAIVVDGDALMVPIIQSEIGAQLQITLGGYRAHDELDAEARSIVLALRPGGHISTGWTLAEQRFF